MNISKLMNNKGLTMNQKMVSFFAFNDSNSLPINNPDFTDLGQQILQLINDKKLEMKGFDNNFNIITKT